MSEIGALKNALAVIEATREHYNDEFKRLKTLMESVRAKINSDYPAAIALARVACDLEVALTGDAETMYKLLDALGVPSDEVH